MNTCVTFLISACMILCQSSFLDIYYSTPDLPGEILTLDDLGLLLEELLDVQTKWYSLGALLKMGVSILDWIRRNFSDPRDCLLEMLKTWLTTSLLTSQRRLEASNA